MGLKRPTVGRPAEGKVSHQLLLGGGDAVVVRPTPVKPPGGRVHAARGQTKRTDEGEGEEAGGDSHGTETIEMKRDGQTDETDWRYYGDADP